MNYNNPSPKRGYHIKWSQEECETLEKHLDNILEESKYLNATVSYKSKAFRTVCTELRRDPKAVAAKIRSKYLKPQFSFNEDKSSPDASLLRAVYGKVGFDQFIEISNILSQK